MSLYSCAPTAASRILEIWCVTARLVLSLLITFYVLQSEGTP